ncbi:MAG: DUF1186 domain-containing protein, partial [bacterium]|nr:DUF1186 domain-containing protein [bacterium]
WILKEFEFFDGTYKREAVEAAIELKEEITPYLVHILEDVPTDPKQYGEKLFVHIYASMLLYYFRETSAHQILINAFSLPGEKPYLVFGDITGEYFPAILYATCGGDLSALKKMFHNESIKDMSVRINALEAMAYAAIENEEVRPQVIDFLKDIMHSVLKKYPHGLQGKKDYALEDMRMISLLIWVLCFLYPDELKEKIQTAFDMEIVDLGLISREFVDNTFEKGREQVLADQRLRIKDKLEADIHSRIMWIYETDSDDAESGEDQPAKKATPGTVTKKSNSSKKNNKSKKKKKKKKKAKK